ncbi:hypothetical protein AB3X52_01620 [Nocardioides sp. DS6]|uniref:PE domain-containing protein n=1 Tax=Nocardioides eburneus TaxID=3231482 RepID=A0ABV3SUN6_9ACTN
MVSERPTTPPSTTNTTSGSTSSPSTSTGGSGSGTTVVDVDLLDDLMKLLGHQADHLHSNVVTALSHRPDPGRFGNAPLARRLSAKVDGTYADLYFALDEAVTGLRNYRDGFKAYRDGMTDHDTGVAATARKTANATPVLTAGDNCFDDTTATVCTPTDQGSED